MKTALINTPCACGKTFQFGVQEAGKQFRCPACQATIVIPAPAPADSTFDHDRFLINQKLALSTQYSVTDEDDRPLAYVHRPKFIGRSILLIAITAALLFGIGKAGLLIYEQVSREITGGGIAALIAGGFALAAVGFLIAAYLLAPIRNVTFYRTEEMLEPLMTVRQDFKLVALTARYTLLDAKGATLACFSKNYLHNIYRRRWDITDADGKPLCTALEDSQALAILRRLMGPMMGVLRTNFIIQTALSEEKLGEFNRQLTLFDKYVLDMSADWSRKLDRRIALAIGVMLDTGEGR